MNKRILPIRAWILRHHQQLKSGLVMFLFVTLAAPVFPAKAWLKVSALQALETSQHQGQVKGIATNPEAAKTLVIYNASWTGDEDNDGTQDSLEVAQYYMQKRGIPAANLLGVTAVCSWCGPAPTDTAYDTYADFYNNLITPLQNKLNELGQTNIDYIVTSYRMPFKQGAQYSGYSGLDTLLMVPFFWNATTNNIGSISNPYSTLNPTFSADKSHFNHTYKLNNTNMYVVGRLDNALGVNAVLNMIDQDLYADRYFVNQPGYYNGKAYVAQNYNVFTDAQLSADTDVKAGNYGSYPSADKNVAYTEHYLAAAGMPYGWGQTSIDGINTILQDGSSSLRPKDAFLYAGWYKKFYNLFGDWLPGSYANDLNSDSLNIRAGACANSAAPCSRDQDAVVKGVSNISGVIEEPYVNGHPRSNVAIYYLLKGYTFGEAAMLSYNVLGWKHISIGDPLYAPFASKTLVKDYIQPVMAAGYPKITKGVNGSDRVINIMVNDNPEPEVIKAIVEYGLDTNYGMTAVNGLSSGATDTYGLDNSGYFRRVAMTLPNLQAGATYHFRVRMTDPSGNTTLTGDYTFNTSTNTISGPVPSAPSAGGSLAVSVPFQTLQSTAKIPAVIDVAISGGSGSYAASWSQVSGPAVVTFTDANRPTPSVYFPVPGFYTLKITVNDGASSVSRDISFNVINPDPSFKFGQTTLTQGDGSIKTFPVLTAPGKFEVILDQNGFWSLFDLKNDPQKNWQLAGADHAFGVWTYCWPSGTANVCASDESYWASGGALTNWRTLENTPARVKTQYSGIAQGLPLTFTLTFYPSGRVVMENVIQNNGSSDAVFNTVRFWLGSQQNQKYLTRVASDFHWFQIYGSGNNPIPFSVAEFLSQSNYFQPNGTVYNAGFNNDSPGFTLPKGQTERIIVNYTYQPDSTVLNSSAAVEAYAQDFKNPATLAFALGSANTTDPEDNNSDGYIEGEGAYGMNASNNAVGFTMDGTGIVRHSPVFKISNYTANTATVHKDGVMLVPGVDYVSSPLGNSTMLVQYLGDISSASVFDISSTGNVIINPPTVAAPAAANPSTVTGTTTALSVLGADGSGESSLTYTWSATGPAPVTFSSNNSNAAKNTVATFAKEGSYILTATIKNQNGYTVQSPVTVTVKSAVTSLIVTPTEVSLTTGGSQQFVGSAQDQFNNVISSTTLAWSVSGGGSISQTGLFTAGNAAGGPWTVTAKGDNAVATSSVIVTAPAPDTQAPSVPANVTAAAVSSAQVELSWSASTDNEAVTGYRVYRNGAIVGTTTAVSYTDSGLTPATNYTYTVNAYDAAGNQSAQSAAVSAATPAVPVCGQPGNNTFTGCYYQDTVLNDLVLSRTDAYPLNFDWGSDSPDPVVPTDLFSAKWEGNFDFTAGSYVFTATVDDGVRLYIDNQLVIDKWVTQSPTTYTYTADLAAGNHLVKMEYFESGGGAVAKLSWSGVQQPPASDTFAPTVPSGVTATAVSVSQVNLSWAASTDNVAVTGYNIYRSGSKIGTVTANSYSDSAVSPATAYSYTVSAFDAAGNTSAQSAPATVTTPAPADVTAPAISAVSASAITASAATVSWTTNEPATSFVDYGLSTSYGQSAGNSTLTTVHSVNLSGLSSASTYHFKVRSADSAGNQATSQDNSFTTAVDPTLNTAPAAIANLKTSQPTKTSIKLQWTAPGSSGSSGTASSYDIRYSTSPITEANWANATQVTGEPNPSLAGTTQSYTIVGLSPNTKYYTAIKTTNAFGLISALSNVASFTTKAKGR